MDSVQQALDVALHALNMLHLSDPNNLTVSNALNNIANILNRKS